MRFIILILSMATFCTASAAWAQDGRFEIGAVTRFERVSFEGGADGQVVSAGVTGSARIWRQLRVTGELTDASKNVRRSYEGGFVSFAAPNSSREEIDRSTVIARRSLEYVPGLGGSIALSTHADLTSRVGADLVVGVSARRYLETSTMTILRVPEGIDSARATQALPNERFDRTRSGLLLGFGVPVQLASHLTASPEIRWVWGGPARVGDNYDELSAGVRVTWRP